MVKIEIQERDGTSVPCFLKDVCCPLVRAGQQLEVLVKLLNVCNFAVNEEYESCNLVDLEGILPFWVYKPNNSASLRNQLTFSRKGIQALLQKREIMYDAVLKKLQVFFANLDARYQRMHRNVRFFSFPFFWLINDVSIDLLPCLLLTPDSVMFDNSLLISFIGLSTFTC